jgi:hypothetical protein
MRHSWIPLSLILLASASSYAFAQDFGGLVGKKKKPRRAPAAAAITNDLQQTSWKGELAAAPANATNDVVAMLKQQKPLGGALPIPLRAQDPVLATRLRELSQPHANHAVVLTAHLDPDGTTLLVTDLRQLPSAPKPTR